jgi:hypothetical protein
MWKEQNDATKGHRNFGDEWGRLSITLKKTKPFSFSLLMDNHFVEYDGLRILYSGLDNWNSRRRPSAQALKAPSIPLEKFVETFKSLCKRIDPEVKGFVLGKIDGLKYNL